LIAEQLPLLPVQQVRQLGDVGYAGSGRSRRMDDTALIRSDVHRRSRGSVGVSRMSGAKSQTANGG